MSSPEWFISAINSKPENYFVEVDGAKIHYTLWGDSTKPGLFFVHGYSANANWWDFIAPHFLDNYSIAAINLSGNGDSEHRGDYSQELYARELKAVCEDLNWSSASFIAHSMGGSISLKATSFFPEIFKKLILLDSIVVLPPDKTRSMGKSMIRADFIYESLEEAIASFRLIPPQPCRNNYILEYIAKNSFKENSEGWQLKSDGKMMKSYQSSDLTDILMSPPCPVYLVYGLMSQIFPAELVEYTKYVGNLPDDRVVGIPGTMHHLFIDDPLRVVEELKKILGVV
jgi:pimeloyl-ACP methyl ester carboxylesterase